MRTYDALIQDMCSTTLLLFSLVLQALHYGVESTYSFDDVTLTKAELKGALSHPTYATTILQDGFRSQFLYNGSKVLFENLGSLLYAQIRTLNEKKNKEERTTRKEKKYGHYYHLWAGFEDGAFLGYYDKGINVAADKSLYTISWQTSYNHSCNYTVTKSHWEARLNVPASGLSYPGWPSDGNSIRLDSYCREVLHANKDTGEFFKSFSGQAYDCRMRGWYFLVKRNPVTQWTGVVRMFLYAYPYPALRLELTLALLFGCKNST